MGVVCVGQGVGGEVVLVGASQSALGSVAGFVCRERIVVDLREPIRVVGGRDGQLRVVLKYSIINKPGFKISLNASCLTWL